MERAVALKQMECRDWGHAWEVAYLARDEDGVLIRRLNCLRCETGRFDYIESQGLILGRAYRYVEGYLSAPGTGKPDRAAVRRKLTDMLWKDRELRFTGSLDDLPNRRLLDG